MSRQKLELNAPFFKEDIDKGINNKIICKKMNDAFPVRSGTPGIVTKVTTVMGEKQYEVTWKTGRKLSMIDGFETIEKKDKVTGKIEKITQRVDEWWKVIEEVPENDKIEERFIISKKTLLEMDKKLPEQFIKYSRFYDLTLIHEFLENLRESGVVNMFGCGPYLYLGKNKIEDLHRYELNHSDMDDGRKDAFEKVLDLAEKVKSILILGASKQIKNQDSENFLSNLSRKVEREASEIARLWFKFYGKERFKKKK